MPTRLRTPGGYGWRDEEGDAAWLAHRRGAMRVRWTEARRAAWLHRDARHVHNSRGWVTALRLNGCWLCLLCGQLLLPGPRGARPFHGWSRLGDLECEGSLNRMLALGEALELAALERRGARALRVVVA